MRFEWDDAKNRANLRKHRVGFELATDAFGDPNRIEIYDDRHDEDRWILIGSVKPSVLVVVYTVREEEGEVFRLISARKANAKEKSAYRANDN